MNSENSESVVSNQDNEVSNFASKQNKRTQPIKKKTSSQNCL